jgi:hypothetical protein
VHWSSLARPNFLESYRPTQPAAERSFTVGIRDYLRSGAGKDRASLKWVQAETPVEPDSWQAQTGLLQGVGLLFRRLNEMERVAGTATPSPDSLW